MQFMALNLLPRKGESISIGDLARQMNLRPATVAKTVDSLEEQGGSPYISIATIEASHLSCGFYSKWPSS